MANLVQSVRSKILRGNFLSAKELSQEEYNLVTDVKTTVKTLLTLHDKLFGGNLRKIPCNCVADMPYSNHENQPDIISVDSDDSSDDSGRNNVPEPVLEPSLCQSF